MTNREKTIYQNSIIDYLKKYTKNDKIKDGKMFKCILCNDEGDTAQVFQNIYKCLHPDCHFSGDIFDLIKKVNPSFKDYTLDEIGEYLSCYLKIDINKDTDILLSKYEMSKFYLFPLKPSNPNKPSEGKEPVSGFKWTTDASNNKEVWKNWIDRGFGLGLKLGKDSNVVAIDIDSDETFEKIKDLLPETLQQQTSRGKHYVFSYEECYDGVNHANLRTNGLDMELRANNAYIAIAPTSTQGEVRTWNNQKIIKMPDNLKKFVFDNINNLNKNKNNDDLIQDAINKNDLGKDKLSGLDGCRNDTFVKFGGALRKKLNIEQTEYTLNLFNSMLEKQVPQKEIKGMVGQLAKYKLYDKEELCKNVLDRLTVIKECTAFQLSKTMAVPQIEVEDVLNHLEVEGKLSSYKGRFRKIEELEWKEDFDDDGIPVNFEVPFFNEYAYFNWQDLVILGSKTGGGKTSLTANIIKSLVKQGIKPYLINTESGSRFGKYTNKLGLKSGDFFYTNVKTTKGIEFPDNAVVILDWLKAEGSDFAKISETYGALKEQIKKHNCFLFCMEQLRKDNGKFIAENLHDWYASFVATYVYGNNGVDNINTMFVTKKIRDSKKMTQSIVIPTTFDINTWEIKLKK